MNRRRFLLSSSAITSAAMSARLLAAFGDSGETGGPKPVDRKAAVAAAAKRAAANGKPLLVIVVPADPQQLWERGQLLGAWLNRADADELADLLLCEPVCATLADLDPLMPGLGQRKSEPMFLLIDVATMTAAHLNPELPKPLEDVYYGDLSESEIRHAKEGVLRVSNAVRSALRGDGRDPSNVPPALLQERAATSARALGADRVAALNQALDALRLTDMDLLDDGAAIVHARVQALPRDAAKRVVESLAARARERFVKARLPGAKWASDTGCGSDVEPVEGEGGSVTLIACGMGRIPPLGARFLYFYTD